MAYNLDYVKEKRGLKFVEKGMRVEHSYGGKTQIGKIVSGNSSGNLNILFEGKKKYENCHPLWAMKYFDKNGGTIAEYGE
jgi:hypothetical protein